MKSVPETILIGDRRIGTGERVYIVAEMSANHGGCFERAAEIVRAAARAGAEAVKLQTYTADTMTLDSEDERFRASTGTIWEGRSLHDLYAEAATPWDWLPKLRAIADEVGVDLFSTPFDETAVEFLERAAVPAYKIASFELVDLPLIRRVARTGRPLILSTGMATLEEIDEAVRAAREAGCPGVALLKCTSAYPAPPEEMNLRTIPHLAARFDVPVGLSDHSLGSAAAVAAVALGASIIEKHFTMSRELGGPDSLFSMEPHEFERLVGDIRAAERALGAVRYGPGPREAPSLAFRRSLFVVKDVRAGETLTRESVRAIRPGHGLPPKHLEEVLGRRAARDIPRGTPLAWDLLE